jgi:hypothetical protein
MDGQWINEDCLGDLGDEDAWYYTISAAPGWT